MTESTERLYNVVAKKTGHISDDLLRRGLAEKSGLSAANIDGLMRKLQTSPKVRIGSSVPESKARHTKQVFEAAGLGIRLDPVLSLAAMEQVADDGKIDCPACDERVELTEERQCPACGVYVDKVSPEFIARKKLEREEREKLKQIEEFARQKEEQENRKNREEQLRNEIRKELEKELGIGKEQEGRRRSPVAKATLMSLGALAFTALGFGGGYMLSDALQQPEVVQVAASSSGDMEDESAQLSNTEVQAQSEVLARVEEKNNEEVGSTDGVHHNFYGKPLASETVLSLLQLGMPDAARDVVGRVSAAEATSPETLVDRTVASLVLQAWQLTAGQA